MTEVPLSNLKWQRVAASVANHLRDRILTGELQDGDLLPKEDVLRATYPVSKPSLREAMRILETEGLISIRRGNMGGAVVHRPSASNVAYTLALVLRSQGTGTVAVAKALQECEPACAALCAERKDRKRAVLPKLRALQKEAVTNVSDLVQATNTSRRFHEAIVELCGNEPLKVIVGALEVLWSSHETDWANHIRDPGLVPVEERQHALDIHAELIDLIAAGDSVRVRELNAEHLQFVQRYPSEVAANGVHNRKHGAPIDPMLIRFELGDA
jgi:DNA-binding FadR family transcriptional regulator